MLIGILALQGDFAEHRAALRALGVDTRLVRLPAELSEVDGLIIPGGESTTMALLLDRYALREPLRARLAGGLPSWGTCAGMVLLARRLTDPRPQPLGIVDMVVSRNAFGRQVDSFETELSVDGIGGQALHAVFIRAPVVRETGAAVRVLARLPDGRPVAVQQGPHLATAFHPELTADRRLHRHFLATVAERGTVRAARAATDCSAFPG
ncbi:MAG: pyridoxal 5'-phosphate synthase glutaminase subunit PdxT [Spirochaetaceae bacterium]|nr:pyridoxal 5'-phosphate synthase glutaminase subunit PdxT [Spirochaetaceae bacterium]MDE0228962.1 pyridoxal 5'-phosphate synthase glutaminase subunit PdxT [Spirochaetaceae bacterium]MDE0446037.1 pyridoxal 5'-phosphate synthase glutaminase subunit PdxT [Spirochaetaceae bacterium]